MANNHPIGRQITITSQDSQEIDVDFDELEAGFQQYVGHGNYGSVCTYVLEKPGLKMTFAMKRIEKTVKQDDQNKELRDLQVHKTIGDSPYIIKFYGVFFAEGSHWLVMEPMDASLEQFYLKAHQLKLQITEAFLSKVAFSILQGIKHLREKDIIHHDVKPSNVLISRNGSIKLCDFGISSFLTDSISNSYTGCLTYMSPERIRSESHTIKSDIWSLGISLIEIAKGEHPYIGSASSPVLMNRAVLRDDSPTLPIESYPDGASFVDLCLKKKADERPRVTELLDHPFIINYENTEIDLVFVKNIINQIPQL